MLFTELNNLNFKMKQIQYRLSTIMLGLSIGLASILISCGDDDDPKKTPDPNVTADLTIATIDPATAKVGAEVTITGTGFDSDFTQNTVKFADDANASVKKATDTTLIVIVPAGAKTGKIQVLANGQTATSEGVFTLDESLDAPELVELNTSQGLPGQEIKLSGYLFGELLENLEVKFGAEETELISLENRRNNFEPVGIQHLTVKVPSLEEGDVEISLSRDGMPAVETLTFHVDAIPQGVNAIYYKTAQFFYKGIINGEGAFSSVLQNDNEVNGINNIVIDETNEKAYWQFEKGIYQAGLESLSTDAHELLLETRTGTGKGLYIVEMEVDLTNGMIYAIADSVGHADVSVAEYHHVIRGSLDGSVPFEVLYQYKRELSFVTFLMEGIQPLGLAIDDANGKIYFSLTETDQNSRVVVGSVDGASDTETLFSFTAATHEVTEMVFANGRLFISTQASGILSGSADGSGSLTTLVDKKVTLSDEIKADSEQGYIYWLTGKSFDSEEASSIVRAKMDGTGVEVLFQNSSEIKDFDIEVGEITD